MVSYEQMKSWQAAHCASLLSQYCKEVNSEISGDDREATPAKMACGRLMVENQSRDKSDRKNQMLRKSDSCKIRSEPDLLFRQGCRSGSIQVCVIALHQGLKPTHLLSFSGYCKKPRSCTNSIFFLHYAFPSSPADCKFKLKKVPDTIMVCGHLDSQLQLTPWRGDIFPLP